MKLSDPLIIGYPARGEPLILGTMVEHNLPSDLIIGSYVSFKGKMFVVNVSYVPHNPKREKLVMLLEPKEELGEDFWNDGNVSKEEVRKPPVVSQEEFPF